MKKIEILICTLDSRKNKFNFIFNKITNQIKNNKITKKGEPSKKAQ